MLDHVTFVDGRKTFPYQVVEELPVTWSRTFPTHLWTLIWSCTVQSRLCGGATETQTQVPAEGSQTGHPNAGIREKPKKKTKLRTPQKNNKRERYGTHGI